MRTVYPQGCDQQFAQKTIIDICSIVNEMHKLGVMHRSIHADVIGMRICTKGPMVKAAASYIYVVRFIGGLSRVLELQPEQKVVEAF